MASGPGTGDPVGREGDPKIGGEIGGEVGREVAQVRAALLGSGSLVRAIASGRRRGAQLRWRRVELRYVDLKDGRKLQVTSYDETQAFITNHGVESAPAAVEELVALPFASWHVETTTELLQVRVTKKGKVLVHRAERDADVDVDRSHDREKQRRVSLDAPFIRRLRLVDDAGSLKPSKRAKYHQVEELVAALATAWEDAAASGAVPEVTAARPLRVVDLGCGNGLLTFAAHHYLRSLGLSLHTTGVDRKAQSRRHNEEVAHDLGWAEEMTFVEADIGAVTLTDPPDVVLALHACDTATDDALARAVEWQAPLVLAAPCCHHDVSAQLRDLDQPRTRALLRDGILRERLADTLTDALRASLLRGRGYRVDVVEFVGSQHTPRNTLIRAVRTGARPAAARAELDELLTQWPVRPRLLDLLERSP